LLSAAETSAEAAIAAGNRSSMPPMELAAIAARRGDADAAVRRFDAAVDAGLRDAEFPRVDPLLAAAHADPRFAASLARIERDVDAMRKRTDIAALNAFR
jgi:hypothetical protein